MYMLIALTIPTHLIFSLKNLCNQVALFHFNLDQFWDDCFRLLLWRALCCPQLMSEWSQFSPGAQQFMFSESRVRSPCQVSTLMISYTNTDNLKPQQIQEKGKISQKVLSKQSSILNRNEVITGFTHVLLLEIKSFDNHCLNVELKVNYLQWFTIVEELKKSSA